MTLLAAMGRSRGNHAPDPPLSARSGYLRLVSYLAPGIPAAVYELLAARIGADLGTGASLVLETRTSGPPPDGPDPFEAAEVDVGFLCAPTYCWLRDSRTKSAAAASNRPSRSSVELVPAAPVFDDPRVEGRPVYLSDVVVRSSSSVSAFEQLRGKIWAYNDPCSLSGWLSLVRKLGEPAAPARFFGSVVESGSHRESLRRVAAGEADAAAIDSNVLALALRADAELGSRLRVIESWGPFPIQPVVVRSALDPVLKRRLARSLLALHQDPPTRRALARFGVVRFAPVTEADYLGDGEAARRASRADAVLTAG